MTAHGIFIELFDATVDSVGFKSEWKNGTGYLNGICHESNLVSPGQVVKTVDDYGRRVLIAGTNKGPVAVFERYIDTLEGIGKTIVCNFPREIHRESSGLGSSSITEEHLNKMFRYGWDDQPYNIIDDFAVVRK